MVRIPRWEQLAEALARVREATGQSQTEAQADICGAIADGAVKIQCALRQHSIRRTTSIGTILQGDHFQIPRDLKPSDFDWAASRPLKPWLVRRESFKIPGHWHLHWIELLRADVSKALCEPEVKVKPVQRSKDEKILRSRPALERARRAVVALFPDGVPPQSEVPNSILCKCVGDWLKRNQLPNLSNDTIVRAAGRRK